MWDTGTRVEQVRPVSWTLCQPLPGQVGPHKDPDTADHASLSCPTLATPSSLCLPVHLYPAFIPSSVRSLMLTWPHICEYMICSRHVLYSVPCLPFRDWGPEEGSLRNRAVLCSVYRGVSSTGEAPHEQRRALTATREIGKTRCRGWYSLSLRQLHNHMAFL